MMGEVAMATRWLYIRPWKVLWLIFASIVTHSLATTVSPTTVQRMSTKELTTVLPSDLHTQVTSGNGLETTTAQSNIQSLSMTLATQVTTSNPIEDGLTTLLPSTEITSQSQQPTTFSSRTTSLSNQSVASVMPTSGTTNVKTMPLLSTSVGSATTIGLSTVELSTTMGSSTVGSSTTIGLLTSIGSSTTEHLSTSVGSSSTGFTSPMGMESTLAISVTKRQTSGEQVSDMTSDVISGTTFASGGDNNSSNLSVVHWFLIAVALAAVIFFLFICYHFCQVRRSKKDQTYANHNKNFIEYATPQSPKEKWRNSWALEAMIYHIELPQENSAEMEAKDNVVFEEDETDAPSSSNDTRPHLTKL